MKEFLLKNKLVIMLIIVAVLLTTIGLSYAFMPNRVVVSSSGDAGVQVIAGDGYTLKTIRNISEFETVTGENYKLLNLSADVTLTTGEQIDTTYDLFYNVKTNNYLDGTTTPTAKVIVKIYNPSGTEITSLTGLSRVTVGSITGFNLTDYKGAITLADDQDISTSSTTTQNWQVKVYLYDTTGLSNISNTIFDSEITVENPIVIPVLPPSTDLPQSTDLILRHNGGQAAIEAKAEPNFAQAATTDEGMFAITDEYGTSYYYRGAIDNNWMLYNGIYWRIVRIAGNGSIKLLYSGTTAPTSSTATVMTGSGTQIGTSTFNSTSNNNAYVGYMYTLNQRHGLDIKSTIATALDNWYTAYMNGVDSQIADNTFCYDRSLATGGYQDQYHGWNGSTYTGTGIGTSGTLYGTHIRLTASSSTYGPGGTGPELGCPSKFDAYTVDDTTNGNGALSEKVGLLTADEAVMAGLAPGITNSSNYLYTNSYYWLGSPFGFYSFLNYAYVWRVISDGRLYGFNVGTTNNGARPSVYLSSLVSISGTGTWNDPYKIN